MVEFLLTAFGCFAGLFMGDKLKNTLKKSQNQNIKENAFKISYFIVFAVGVALMIFIKNKSIKALGGGIGAVGLAVLIMSFVSSNVMSAQQPFFHESDQSPFGYYDNIIGSGGGGGSHATPIHEFTM